MALCTVSELQLFSENPLQMSILESRENVYAPLTSVDGSSILQFSIPASSEYYTDLTSICLRLKLQILKSDNTKFNNTTTEKKLQDSFVNNILHSLFKSVRVSLNGAIVSETDNYHYKAYLDSLLNLSPNQIVSTLAPRGFSKDSRGQFDELDFTKNEGARFRKTLSDDSSIFEVYDRLYIDVFNQPKLLLNGVGVDISLALEKEEFFLMGKQSSIVKIHEAELYVRHVKVNPQMALDNYKILNSDKLAIYPFKRSEIKTFTVAKGVNSVELHNIFNGLLPTNFTMVMVENDAFVGSKTKNPFNFNNFGSKMITFYINGNPVPPTPLEHNFDSVGTYSRTYSEFLKSVGSFFSRNGCLVNREDYKDGYFITNINLGPRQTLDDSLCQDIPKEGSLSLGMRFDKSLASTITILIYGEYDAVLKVDKHLNVSV